MLSLRHPSIGRRYVASIGADLGSVELGLSRSDCSCQLVDFIGACPFVQLGIGLDGEVVYRIALLVCGIGHGLPVVPRAVAALGAAIQAHAVHAFARRSRAIRHAFALVHLGNEIGFLAVAQVLLVQGFDLLLAIVGFELCVGFCIGLLGSAFLGCALFRDVLVVQIGVVLLVNALLSRAAQGVLVLLAFSSFLHVSLAHIQAGANVVLSIVVAMLGGNHRVALALVHADPGAFVRATQGKAMVAAVLVKLIALQNLLAVRGIGGVDHILVVIEQVQLVGNRGVGLGNKAGKRADGHVLIGREDICAANGLVAAEYVRVRLRQIVVLIDDVAVAIAVRCQVEVVGLKRGNGPVVVRDPEVAGVLALRVFQTPALARAVGEIGSFGAPAVLHQPCAVAFRLLMRIIVEVARRIIVIPAHDGNAMVHAGVVVGEMRPRVRVQVLRHASSLVGSGNIGEECAGNGAVLVLQLVLDVVDGLLVDALELAILVHHLGVGQDVRVLELEAGGVPQVVAYRPGGVLGFAVGILVVAGPAVLQNAFNVGLGFAFLCPIRGKVLGFHLAVLVRYRALDKTFFVLVLGGLLVERADARSEDAGCVQQRPTVVDAIVFVTGAVVIALARLGFAYILLGSAAVPQGREHQLQLGKVEGLGRVFGTLAVLLGAGKDRGFACGGGREAPARAPRILKLNRRYQGVFRLGKKLAVGVKNVCSTCIAGVQQAVA